MPENSMFGNIMLAIIRYIIRYLRNLFALTPVLFTLGIILFTIFAINPDFSLGFLDKFSLFPSNDFAMDEKDIMEAFFVVSLIFLVLGDLAKFLLKKYFNKEIIVPLKRKMLIAAVLITIVYVVATIAFLTTSVEGMKETVWVLFPIMYLTNLFSLLIYLGVKKVADSALKILDGAQIELGGKK